MSLGCSAGEQDPPERVGDLSEPLAARPTALAPLGTTTNNPQFRWSPAPGTLSYRLWIDDASGPRVVDQTLLASAANCPTGMEFECAFSPGHVLAPGAGKFWVQGIDASGPGPWSPAANFFAASVPTLIAPAGPGSTGSPAYQWNSVPGATSYTLWVDDSTARPKINQTVTAAAAGCDSVGTCSYTPSTAVAPGKATWWVRAGTGAWSAPLKFEVAACGPDAVRAVRMVEIYPGSWDEYIKVRNTHPTCAVDLSSLVVFRNSMGEFQFPSYVLAPGAEAYVGDHGSNPDIVMAPDAFIFNAPGEFYVELCVGPCAVNGSNVIDAVTLLLDTASYTNQPPPQLPHGVTFGPTPLTEARRDDTRSFLRIAFGGASPAFVTSDWQLGSATGSGAATACKTAAPFGFQCPVLGMVCRFASGPGCECGTARDPSDPAFYWFCF